MTDEITTKITLFKGKQVKKKGHYITLGGGL